MKNKVLQIGLSNFKLDKENREFTCYGNVKGNIDHARDRTVDGAYQKSIQRHMENGTMPKMFWMHNPFSIPVGKWLEMREDEKGLFMRGKLFSESDDAKAIYEAAKEGALDSFSIGYSVVEEKWNRDKGCNDLIELDIKEVSWVTFACNEESLLQDIKNHMEEGKLPTKAEIRELLKMTGVLSKRQIDKITAAYNPDEENEEIEIDDDFKSILDNSSLFK